MKCLLTIGAILLLVSSSFSQEDGIPAGVGLGPGLPVRAVTMPPEDQRRAGVVAALIMMRDRPILDMLEMSADQKHKIRSELKKLTDVHNGTYVTPAERAMRKADIESLSQSIYDQLIDVQIEELIQLTGSNPLEMLAISKVVGRHFEMTEAQQKRIQDRSNKLGKEIREFMLAKRREAAEILKDELSMEQQDKMGDLFESNRVTNWLKYQTASSMAWNLSFGNPERDKLEKHGWHVGNYARSPDK